MGEKVAEHHAETVLKVAKLGDEIVRKVAHSVVVFCDYVIYYITATEKL